MTTEILCGLLVLDDSRFRKFVHISLPGERSKPGWGEIRCSFLDEDSFVEILWSQSSLVQMIQSLVVGLEILGTEEIFFVAGHLDISLVDQKRKVVIEEFVDLVVSLEIWVLDPKEIRQHMVLNIQADLLLVCVLAALKLSRPHIVPSVNHKERHYAGHQKSVLDQIGGERLLSPGHHIEQPSEGTELLDVLY